MNEVAVRVKGLYKRYGDVEANSSIDLKILKGSIHGILGPNGAGKTTLIRQLTTEVMPSEGSVMILGIDAISDPHRIRRIIGVAAQECSLYEYLTTEQHIYFFCRLHGISRKDSSRKTEKLLHDFSLLPHAKKEVSQLSGGLKKRVLLALSLINEPKILFLDEPTTGLDPEIRREVWEYIKKLNESGTTIVLSTQDMQEADTLCDMLTIINKGRIVLTAKKEEIKAVVKSNLRISLPIAMLSTLQVKAFINDTGPDIMEANGMASLYVEKNDSQTRSFISDLTQMNGFGQAVISEISLEDAYLKVVRRN